MIKIKKPMSAQIIEKCQIKTPTTGIRHLRTGLKNNDEALAYGIIIVIGSLLLGGLLFTLVAYGYNSIIGGANMVHGMGIMTEQTQDVISWNINIFTVGVPIITMFVFAIWGIVRANDKKT